MADGKIFTDDTKDKLVEAIDDAVKLGVLGELIDGPAIRVLINIIDKKGDKFVPDNLDPALNEFATLIVNKKYEEAGAKAGSILNILIDIPVMGEDTEEHVFTKGLEFLVTLIMNGLKGKESQ